MTSTINILNSVYRFLKFDEEGVGFLILAFGLQNLLAMMSAICNIPVLRPTNAFRSGNYHSRNCTMFIASYFYYLICHTALTKMDDLLNEMKSDLSKLPFQLAKIDSVTNQLQMTEVSILSRMASHFSVEHKQKQSQSAAVVSIDPEVMGEASSFTSAN